MRNKYQAFLPVPLVVIALVFSGCSCVYPFYTSLISDTTEKTATLSSPTQIPSPSAAPTLPPSSAIPLPTATLCKLVVEYRTDYKGVYLDVQPCSAMEYSHGPLSDGAYIVDPNEKFLAFVAIEGSVYVARVGDPVFYTLGNLRKEKKFSVFSHDETPIYRLSISENYLIITEDNFSQTVKYKIPRKISG